MEQVRVNKTVKRKRGGEYFIPHPQSGGGMGWEPCRINCSCDDCLQAMPFAVVHYEGPVQKRRKNGK